MNVPCHVEDPPEVKVTGTAESSKM